MQEIGFDSRLRAYFSATPRSVGGLVHNTWRAGTPGGKESGVLTGLELPCTSKLAQISTTVSQTNATISESRRKDERSGQKDDHRSAPGDKFKKPDDKSADPITPADKAKVAQFPERIKKELTAGKKKKPTKIFKWYSLI